MTVTRPCRDGGFNDRFGTAAIRARRFCAAPGVRAARAGAFDPAGTPVPSRSGATYDPFRRPMKQAA